MNRTALRWWTKKLSRQGLALTSWLSGTLAISSWLAPAPRVRVLTYHRFGERSRDPFCVSEESFERQVAHLARTGTAVGLDDVLACLDGHDELPRDAVMVTIDDGYRSTRTLAQPILRRHGVPAVAFVSPSLIDAGEAADGQALPGEPEPYLSWAEVRALADEGLTVGSHAWTHRSLGRMGLEEAAAEARRSREALEQRLGRPVLSFAYPYGTRADCSAEVAMRVRAAGYRVAFTSLHGAVHPGLDPFLLPRIKIESGESLLAFRLAARGGLDGWRAVDHMLWRLQVPEH